MSTQPTTKSKLSAEWHSILAGLQGVIFLVAAIHNDLPSILTQFQTWIPMMGSIAAFIYSKKTELSAAFDAGQTTSITNTMQPLATLLMNGSTDINAIKQVATQLVTTIQAAAAS